jgi:hypothetical protein
MIAERGCEGAGVTVSVIVRGVKRAEERRAVTAAAALDARMVRVGIGRVIPCVLLYESCRRMPVEDLSLYVNFFAN